ncbi:MAG: hypothetical protein Q8L48_32480 [Archangium sp.]|nr:hypothetical protein [Archangium sp.]
MNARTGVMLAVLATGCGVATPGAPVEQFCSTITDEYICRMQQACGVAARDVACEVITNNSRVVWPVCDAPLQQALDAGSVLYDGLQAKQCLDDLATICGVRAACEGVFTGTVTVGGACHTSRECAGETWCDRSLSCPGTCAAKAGAGTVVRAAEICGTSGLDFLADGSVSCQDLEPPGGPCDENSDCQASLVCRQGSCGTAALTGEACTGSECAHGLRCDQGTCRSWAKRGEPCVSNLSSAGGHCQLGLSCRGGICADALAYGEPCGVNPNDCGAGLRCDLTDAMPVCLRRGTEGAACSSFFDCDPGFACPRGRCTAELGAGGACASSRECQFGLRCLEGACATPVCSPL